MAILQTTKTTKQNYRRMIQLKKTMMAMAMAAMTVATTGTALAATPGQGNFQDNVSRIETNNAYCGGGYYGGCRGRRGGYGCGGGYGGGYCWGNENNNEG